MPLSLPLLLEAELPLSLHSVNERSLARLLGELELLWGATGLGTGGFLNRTLIIKMVLMYAA